MSVILRSSRRLCSHLRINRFFSTLHRDFLDDPVTLPPSDRKVEALAALDQHLLALYTFQEQEPARSSLEALVLESPSEPESPVSDVGTVGICALLLPLLALNGSSYVKISNPELYARGVDICDWYMKTKATPVTSSDVSSEPFVPTSRETFLLDSLCVHLDLAPQKDSSQLCQHLQLYPLDSLYLFVTSLRQLIFPSIPASWQTQSLPSSLSCQLSKNDFYSSLLSTLIVPQLLHHSMSETATHLLTPVSNTPAAYSPPYSPVLPILSLCYRHEDSGQFSEIHSLVMNERSAYTLPDDAGYIDSIIYGFYGAAAIVETRGLSAPNIYANDGSPLDSSDHAVTALRLYDESFHGIMTGQGKAAALTEENGYFSRMFNPSSFPEKSSPQSSQEPSSFPQPPPFLAYATLSLLRLTLSGLLTFSDSRWSTLRSGWKELISLGALDETYLKNNPLIRSAACCCLGYDESSSLSLLSESDSSTNLFNFGIAKSISALSAPSPDTTEAAQLLVQSIMPYHSAVTRPLTDHLFHAVLLNSSDALHHQVAVSTARSSVTLRPSVAAWQRLAISSHKVDDHDAAEVATSWAISLGRDSHR